MFMGQSFPKSEASEKGLRLGEMLKDVGLLGATVACFMLGLFFAKDVAPLFGLAESGMVIGLVVGFGLWFAVGGLTGFWIGSVLLFVLFATHALVGAVELGTDGWIQTSLETYLPLSKASGSLSGRPRSCSGCLCCTLDRKESWAFSCWFAIRLLRACCSGSATCQYHGDILAQALYCFGDLRRW